VAEETPAVSEDGRYVAYASVQGGNSQILLRDTCLGAANDCLGSTRTVSVATDGTAGNGDSHNAVLTLDGRFVAFSSAATNLVSSAPAGRQVYLRDTCAGAAADCKPVTSLVSKDEEGKLTGTESILPSISSSGRFVAFLAVTPSAKNEAESATHAQSAAANSGLRQVFVRDTCAGVSNCTPKTTRISLAPGDTPANSAKPAGPALAGLAKQIALSDGKSSTVFTPTMPIDDRVFLAIPKEKQ
jgi:Tol biopolymer transport system component